MTWTEIGQVIAGILFFVPVFVFFGFLVWFYFKKKEGH